ncbi:MAG: chromosome segregation protein SMC [Alphaproteobacteria bacterium]
MVRFTKLRLTGFKSFVESTDLLVMPGVTGIVGPNGCGKSNLVEALRWTMGETSAKRMRGGEMDDVIFAGSASRPSRNQAEVVLYLDNTDRTAPAMFNGDDHLEVARRIDRGAGSSYRVNGKEVRARDVQLLFADSATGAHSTALVSQGRIGTLISAKPTDRRNLLEEAAGITGLHSRRHEAELRLRAAETNLERLDDVIAALEAQHQGLKKQARQATRYRNIAAQIRRTEALAIYLEAEATRQELATAQERLAAAESAVAKHTQEAAEHATTQAEIAGTLPDLRDEEATAAAALQRLIVDRDNLARESALAIAAKEQAVQRLSQLEGDSSRARVLARDAAEARERLDEERAALETATAEEESNTQAAQSALNEAADTAAERETALSTLAERIAADEARATAQIRRTAELDERLTRLRAQADTAAREQESLTAEQVSGQGLSTAEASVQAAEATLETARTQSEDTEAEHGKALTRQGTARETLQHAEAARAKLEAEAAALTAILEPASGGDWPPIEDAVSVETGYEAALGAALGDDITASMEADAPAHWATLPPYDPTAPLPDGAEPLSRQVRAPAALARRLSQTGIVTDAASGARLQPQLAPGQRLVTTDGALWRWDGFTTKADARTAAGKRLAQRNRLNELKTILAEAAKTAAEARAEHDTARAEAERKSAAERAARAAVSAAFGDLNTSRQEHSALVQRAAGLVSRLAAQKEAAQRIATDIAETESLLAAARTEASELPDLAADRASLDQLRTDLSESRGELAQRQSAVDRLAREAEARVNRLSTIKDEKTSWARRSSESEQHIAELEQRLQSTAQEIETLAARPAELAEKGEALAAFIETAEQQRKDAADALAVGETRLRAADRDLKAAEHILAQAREDRVRAEAAVSQAEMALNGVAEKSRDRLQSGLDQVLEIAEIDTDKELPARADIETKLQRLNRERDNMGPVNLRAEVEAKELDEQITGMQTERADLIAAIGRLRQGISSLNREGRARLLAAFARVDAHFSELFVRLFGGGRAHLKLTGSDDPLEAGLEIMASPPGKRMQIMSLLSGGEQALTALSLLFAVFLTNPAPICVLDEVDAPLDDANVDRFCTLLDELSHSGSTRFLVITHHRMTMARVDRLFGVTMAERGISRLVSVDLGIAEGLRESA